MKDNFESKMADYKLKDRVVSYISDELQGAFPQYDFFDITLTPEFCLIEHLISVLVEKASKGSLCDKSYMFVVQPADPEEEK